MLPSVGFVQLLEFLRLAVVHFRPELIVFVHEQSSSTWTELIQTNLKDQFASRPTVQLFGLPSKLGFQPNALNCSYYPARRLTVLLLQPSLLNAIHQLYIQQHIHQDNFNVIVWTRETSLKQFSEIIPKQMNLKWFSYSVILVQAHDNQLDMWAWFASSLNTMNYFSGPNEIFQSPTLNARSFNSQVRRFARATVLIVQLPTIVPPFEYLVKDVRKGDRGGVFLVSSSLFIFSIIAGRMNIPMEVYGRPMIPCNDCADPLSLRAARHGRRRLIKYFGKHSFLHNMR